MCSFKVNRVRLGHGQKSNSQSYAALLVALHRKGCDSGGSLVIFGLLILMKKRLSGIFKPE